MLVRYVSAAIGGVLLVMLVPSLPAVAAVLMLVWLTLQMVERYRRRSADVGPAS